MTFIYASVRLCTSHALSTILQLTNDLTYSNALYPHHTKHVSKVYHSVGSYCTQLHLCKHCARNNWDLLLFSFIFSSFVKSSSCFVHADHESQSCRVKSRFLDSLDPLYCEPTAAESPVLLGEPHDAGDYIRSNGEKHNTHSSDYNTDPFDEATTLQLHELLEGATKWVSRHAQWEGDLFDAKPRSKSFPEISFSEADSKEGSTSLPDSPKCTSPLLDS